MQLRRRMKALCGRNVNLDSQVMVDMAAMVATEVTAVVAAMEAMVAMGVEVDLVDTGAMVSQDSVPDTAFLFNMLLLPFIVDLFFYGFSNTRLNKK